MGYSHEQTGMTVQGENINRYTLIVYLLMENKSDVTLEECNESGGQKSDNYNS
jgi:hypothetical protein